MKKLLVFLCAGAVVLAAVAGSAYALTQTYKTVAGIGNVAFVDEVTVTSIQVQTATKIRARLTSTATTQADTPYTVTLFLDGVPSGTVVLTWTAGQIPGTTKNADFTGLTLAPVLDYGVEVTR